jgi:hypothetical protein
MSNEFDPIVDQWYQQRDTGALFRVVALDGAAGVVEIQAFDGNVEELEMDAWLALDLDLAEAPEDWTGPYDGVAPEEPGGAQRDWRTSVEELRPAEEQWMDTRTIILENVEPPAPPEEED